MTSGEYTSTNDAPAPDDGLEDRVAGNAEGLATRPLDPNLAEIAAIGFAALKILGPFADAFATRLGEIFAETTAAATQRVILRHRTRRSGTTDKMVVVGPADEQTTILLPADLSDEARLALIDLDMAADAVNGKTLIWDPRSATWRPSWDSPTA